MTTDVLIIGAGPTGLMAANQLNRFGIEFLIADEKSSPTEQSRALSVSARSMELYQQLGLADEVVESSKIINGFKLYSGGKQKADVWLTDIGKGLSDFFNPMNIFEQSKNEHLLHDNLQKKNKNVLWNYEFVSLTETRDNIEVVLKNSTTDETLKVTTKYIIACDGAKSPVRHSGNFTFEGGTYENKFFVADTTMIWKIGNDKIILAPSDEIFIAFFPMRGENKFRVIGTLPLKFADRDEINFEDLERVIKEVTKIDLDFTNVGWHSTYKIHHRCVDTFSKGRIFLAGDAAHIHSPAGGQGMNTGLQDAHNITWKMAFVLRGIAKPMLLDTYNQERLPFAQKLLHFTDKGFSFIAGGTLFMQLFRKNILLPFVGFVMKFKQPNVFAFKTLSQLFYSYNKSPITFSQTRQKLAFKAGDKVPYYKPAFLNEFIDPTFHLLHISNTVLTNTKRSEIKNNFPFDVKIVESAFNNSWKRLGVTSDLYVLVRPDHHILYLADRLDKNLIKQNLEKYFATV